MRDEFDDEAEDENMKPMKKIKDMSRFASHSINSLQSFSHD